MKKILLIIAVIFLIFQMIILADVIDIGSPATDREFAGAADITLVDKNNPANLSGKITSIEIWANINLSDVEVATFFVVSGNNLSTRDTHSIGSVTAGSKQTFSGLNITVEAGDYIGLYYNTGSIEYDNTLGVGFWYLAGDQVPCINAAFTFATPRAISLYGTGTTEVGWSHKWNTITIGKWNTKEFTKWNDLE